MTIASEQHPAETPPAQLPAACRDCPQGDACRAVWSQPSQNHLKGARLGLAALAGFILPLATAAGGALLTYHFVGPPGEHSWFDALGALAGLACGIPPAVWIVRVIGYRKNSN